MFRTAFITTVLFVVVGNLVPRLIEDTGRQEIEDRKAARADRMGLTAAEYQARTARVAKAAPAAPKIDPAVEAKNEASLKCETSMREAMKQLAGQLGTDWSAPLMPVETVEVGSNGGLYVAQSDGFTYENAFGKDVRVQMTCNATRDRVTYLLVCLPGVGCSNAVRGE